MTRESAMHYSVKGSKRRGFGKGALRLQVWGGVHWELSDHLLGALCGLFGDPSGQKAFNRQDRRALAESAEKS